MVVGSSSVSAVDAAADRTGSKIRASSASSSNIDALVQKAIRDNLKDLTPTELHGTRNKDGQTCFEVLKARKELNLTDARKYPLGRKLYDVLRAQFRSELAPVKQLRVDAVTKTAGISVRSQLIEAMGFGRPAEQPHPCKNTWFFVTALSKLSVFVDYVLQIQ